MRALSILFESNLRKKKYDDAVAAYVLAKRCASDRPGRPDDGYSVAYWLKQDPKQYRKSVREWLQWLEKQVQDAAKQQPSEQETD